MKLKTQQKILELVKNNYNNIASDFDQTRKKPLWPSLVAAAGQVGSGDSVLDAACGNGRLLEAFKNKEIAYLGLDSSVELIKLAANNYPNHIFQVDDLLSLEKAKNENFDWVFCIAALHHLPGEILRLKVLSNLACKIKTDGKIVLSVWRPGKNKKFLKALRKNFWKKIFFSSDLDFGDALFDWDGKAKNGDVRPRYYHAFKERELKLLISRAGLKIISFEKDDHNFFVVMEK